MLDSIISSFGIGTYTTLFRSPDVSASLGLGKESIGEEAMSGTKGGSTTESETTKDSKSKKRCESSMTKVDPSSVKISLPSKEKDSESMSSLSDSVPRKRKQKQ